MEPSGRRQMGRRSGLKGRNGASILGNVSFRSKADIQLRGVNVRF
jgi:hypothetical protein